MATVVPVSVPFADQSLEAPRSGVSWAAVAAGAFVTAALSLCLMTLGAGVGLSSISPWPSSGLSASRIAPGAIVWIVLVQAASCALGGYLAGRLRTKWTAVHTHEVYFRDTAHGLLVWAVGLVISAFFLSSMAASIAKDGVANSAAGPQDYYVDALLHAERPTAEPTVAMRREAEGILAAALARPDVDAADRQRLIDLVAARTDLDRSRAGARVDEVLTRDRQAIDRMRKSTAHSLYWLFAALLIGAFCASFAATLGGRRRDQMAFNTAGRI
ncbi:MAG TPA: hypothetical protein VGK26_08170 [Thermoanaerobaculia bacterium]